MNKGRIPIIPLSYSERDKAVKKELLVDYDNGKIYVVSAHDKSIIYDLTRQVAEYLAEVGLSADKLFVDINGIGIINLGDYLNILQDDRITIIEYETELNLHNIKITKQEAVEVKPTGNTINLTDDAKQYTTITNSNNYTVVLPATGTTTYMTFEWKLSTTLGKPGITFQGNIKWVGGTPNIGASDISNIKLDTEYVNIIEFTTWDGGATWLAKITTY